MGTSRTAQQTPSVSERASSAGATREAPAAEGGVGNQALIARELDGGPPPGADLGADLGARALAAADAQNAESPASEEGVDREAFEATMRDYVAFLRAPHRLDNYTPPTGAGAFDVAYDAVSGQLAITCRVAFEWVDADPADYPGATPQQLAWTRTEQDQFRDRFLRVCSESWSGHHQFFCSRRFWEGLSAVTRVSFVEDTQRSHHLVRVLHVPPDGDIRSAVGRPHAAWGDGRIVDPWGSGRPEGPVDPRFGRGLAELDSNDLDPVTYPGGHQQITAVHEAGHMLGLGDEYLDAEEPEKPRHNALVQAEFGHGVRVQDDGRIMSTGMAIEPEHGVTFLDALRKATAMEEWGFDQHPLTVGPGPVQQDAPMPQGDARTA